MVFGLNAYAADVAYHVVSKMELGGEGSWDYLTVDSAAKRLYVSRSTHVMVVDLNTEKLVGDIPNTSGVHGIALAPELNRGFISNGQGNSASIFDLKTLAIIGQVPTGRNPDSILYDPATKRVFTFNAQSNDATVFDAASGQVLQTIALGGNPEFSRADGKGRVYVNIESTSEVVEIDSQKLTVLRRFSLAPGEEPSGMGFDVEHHLVFSVCGNQLMTILNTESGKVIATVPIGAGTDGCYFDSGTGLAFSSNGGDGTLTVVRESSPTTFEVAQTVTTQRGARTMTVDPTTHKAYLPAAQMGQSSAPAPGGQRQQGGMSTNGFVILVVGE